MLKAIKDARSTPLTVRVKKATRKRKTRRRDEYNDANATSARVQKLLDFGFKKVASSARGLDEYKYTRDEQ